MDKQKLYPNKVEKGDHFNKPTEEPPPHFSGTIVSIYPKEGERKAWYELKKEGLFITKRCPLFRFAYQTNNIKLIQFFADHLDELEKKQFTCESIKKCLNKSGTQVPMEVTCYCCSYFVHRVKKNVVCKKV